MRIHQDLRGSTDPGVAGKFKMQRMPLEWLDAGCWRLPSGKALAEFALQAGFLAPLLFRADRWGSRAAGGKKAKTPKPDGLLSSRKYFGGGQGE
jgi:hypothetical protein